LLKRSPGRHFSTNWFFRDKSVFLPCPSAAKISTRMELPREEKNSLTKSQQKAVEARGNVLVMAGAGTGKTRTLVARCLDCLERERAALDELLVVTFTEAAAAEMRQRLRTALEEKLAADPNDDHWPRQLALFDLAHIGTLHSFCLKLVRENFHNEKLKLDPQLTVLDEGEARQLTTETLDGQFKAHYAGEDEFSIAVQNLIQIHGGGRDEKIRTLILNLHHYSQTRPDAAGWLAEQIKKFSATEPTEWQRWLLAAIQNWRDEWLPVLESLKGGNVKAAELAGILSRLGSAGVAPDLSSHKSVRRDAEHSRPEACATKSSRELAAEVLGQIISADGNWPAKRKTVLRKPLEDLFDEAAFLATLAPVKDGSDPLAEDWSWVRGQMKTLLRLAQEFAAKFAERKRADGVLDFHDLEQFALKLLWDFSAGRPTSVAESWREKLRFVFVDEYQDINAAQDKIIAALSRDGAEANRFLVGDVKQSIYRFRLADPKIFRDHAKNWRAENGRVIPLAENFRSRESLLKLTNSVFGLLMREEIGGVEYDEDASLKFGSPGTHADFSSAKSPSPRAELLVRIKPGRDEAKANGEPVDLADADMEARLIAHHLKKLVECEPKHEIWDDEKNFFRPVEWRDVAVLLRSPRGKSEIYAKEFERIGVPLSLTRAGFYETAEILDLLSLLRLLDNPLQDVPCIAVLRSPLVGLSLDELAEIRLAASGKHFWTALVRCQKSEIGSQNGAAAKISKFLERFARWRKLATQHSLSECLEAVLMETLYTDWLRAQPRGAQRAANIECFLNLAQSFDQFQRQGLFRFLKFIEAQQEAETEPEVPAVATENAVRLMSVHQSKGLEFPVVVLPDLAKKFNEQDLHGEIIFDEEFGLCPKVKPPSSGRRYPSLPHWLARRRQKHELRGEELRLLYVALTRARDTLVLSTTISEKSWLEKWTHPQPVGVQTIASANSFADWLGIWFASHVNPANSTRGETPLLHWRLVEDEEFVGADKVECGRQKAEIELPVLVEATAKRLRAVLNWEYPQQAATKQKAKVSVTELRRAAEEPDDEAEPVFAPPGFVARNRKSQTARRELSAADYGTAHHKFLQHFALEQTDALALATEAERLVRENYLSADEQAVLDFDALATFWNSELGERIRLNVKSVRRELPFTARFSPVEIAEITGKKSAAGLENEFVIVQGVADLVVLLPQEIWLVDFKTDEVGAEDLPAKIKSYTPQLKLYAGALAKFFARPITNGWLHFLSARRTEKIDCGG
jgi:ATP-dependent helicase/nuclease subunit A